MAKAVKSSAANQFMIKGAVLKALFPSQLISCDITGSVAREKEYNSSADGLIGNIHTAFCHEFFDIAET